jgi:mannose-6-phosphate isomerase-like protein (cupin superfamily)
MTTNAAYRLTGLSIADTSTPIATHQQLGGTGVVYNKALAIPGHLGHPWNSLEYVSIPPVISGRVNSVGEHTQATDEVYYIFEGEGVLTTNDSRRDVSTGLLAIAPKGTRHTIMNTSTEHPLSFLVVELQTPGDGGAHDPVFIELATQLQTSAVPQAICVGPQGVQPQLATVDLKDYFSAPWGMLSLVKLQPGAHVDEFLVEADCDQNIFVVDGYATIFVAEHIRIDSADRHHQNVVIPRGVPRRIVNRASGDSPLMVLCLNVRRDGLKATPSGEMAGTAM